MTTFLELANRYRQFSFDKPFTEEEGKCLWYEDSSSSGNRYKRWKGIWVKRAAKEGDNVIDMRRVNEETRHQSCDWSYLFDHIHYGIITGTRTLAAVQECLDILKNDLPPEDDGTKLRHVNRLGGVNYLSKPVHHDWELTSRLSKILSTAFFADSKDGTLYSDDFVYVYKSHSGCNRSC